MVWTSEQSSIKESLSQWWKVTNANMNAPNNKYLCTFTFDTLSTTFVFIIFYHSKVT